MVELRQEKEIPRIANSIIINTLFVLVGVAGEDISYRQEACQGCF